MKYKKILSFLLVFMLAIVSISFSNKNTIVGKASDDKSSNSGLSIKFKQGNSWGSGSNNFLQIDATLSNTTKSTIKDWCVTIPVDQNTSLDNNWSSDCIIKNGLLSITPLSHNNSIFANDSVSFGFVLKNISNFDEDKAVVTFGNNATSNNDDDSTSSQTNVSTEKEIPPKTTDDWLHTDGSKIYDADGKEVWLTGTNWFGYNTGTNIFDGVWACDLDKTLEAIADRGFNLLRVPFSSELILDWKSGNYPEPCFNDYINDYLAGMNSLEIWDHVVDCCRANGIKIMIDIHSADTNAAGHMQPLWYSKNISEKKYLDSLAWMANRYKDDDTIIAYDLKNEPHGAVGDTEKAIWNDSTDSNNWKYIAEKAAMSVLNENPNALVMVEGIQIYPKDVNKDGDFVSKDKDDYYNTWWGGNLRGVADFPVDLGEYQDKLVYSPHDYGPAVSEQPWFEGKFTKDSLYEECWRDNWFFIQEQNIAPLLIGEWGGFMTEPNLSWMTAFREFLIENKINHTFWCFNANSGDTGGLVMYDFSTWDEEKYAFVKKALWQRDNKFVGLDHQIPLGANGITLSDY